MLPKLLLEKWYIKRTPDTAHEINNWFSANTKKVRNSRYGYLYYPEFHGSTHAVAIQQSYKEITYREFLEGISKGSDNYQIF